jgi:tetratricopeptide (TPR) repeat protein
VLCHNPKLAIDDRPLSRYRRRYGRRNTAVAGRFITIHMEGQNMSTTAHSPAFHEYFHAGLEAYRQSEMAAAAALFEEALAELAIPDPAWAGTWRWLVIARMVAGDDAATVRAVVHGAEQIIAAGLIDLPSAQVRPWLEAGWFAMCAEGLRDEVAEAFAPLAVAFANDGRRHLSYFAAHALDLMAASLLDRGEFAKAAAIDRRLRRISPKRASILKLDLSQVRSRYSRATAWGIGHD